MVLAGQSIDDVDADLHPTLLQLLIAAQKIGIAVAAVDPLTGDGEKEALIGPQWSLKKLCVLNEIDKELVRRDSWQGKFYQK